MQRPNKVDLVDYLYSLGYTTTKIKGNDQQQGIQLEEKVSLVEVKLNQLNLEKSFLNKDAVESVVANAIVEIKNE